MSSFINPKGLKNALGEYPTVDVPEGWPAAHLVARPRDEQGQRILDFAALYRSHPDFPPSPWDPRVGDISLIPPDQSRPEKDEMPFYRIKENGFLGPNLYNARDEVKFSGWAKFPSNLEALNQSAKLVLAYQSRYGAGRLPGQPHTAEGVLNLPSPALFGTPQNYVHRGTIGELSPV
jgi:hypothetical protein